MEGPTDQERWGGEGGKLQGKMKRGREGAVGRPALKHWGGQGEASRCADRSGNRWTEVDGWLVTTGEAFKQFGYGFGFRRPAENETVWSIPFGQVVAHLREQGVSDELAAKYIPEVEELRCTGVDPEEEVVQLQLINMLGLLYITFGLVGIGVTVGLFEGFLRFCSWICPCLCGSEGKHPFAAAYQVPPPSSAYRGNAPPPPRPSPHLPPSSCLLRPALPSLDLTFLPPAAFPNLAPALVSALFYACTVRAEIGASC